MKKFSFIFVLIFILSAVVAPIGASADAIRVFLNENGSLSDYAPKGSTARKVIQNESINSVFSVDKLRLQDTAKASDFTTVTGGNQKDSEDKYINFKYTSTGNDANYNAPRIHMGKKVAADSGYKYQIYEFDVMFGNENSSVIVGFQDPVSTKSDNVAYCNVMASSSATKYTGVAHAKYETCGVNEWHKVKVVARIDGTAEKLKMYIDDSTTPIESNNTYTSAGLKGSSYACVFFPSKANLEENVYLDNLKIYLEPNVNEITVSGNDVNVTYTGTETEGKVVLAAYDSNGCTYATAKDLAASVDFTDFITNAGAYTKLKAFYVDGMDTLTPYCEPTEIQ